MEFPRSAFCKFFVFFIAAFFAASMNFLPNAFANGDQHDGEKYHHEHDKDKEKNSSKKIFTVTLEGIEFEASGFFKSSREENLFLGTLNPEFNYQWKGFRFGGEFELELRSKKEGEEDRFNAEIEKLFLGYSFADWLTLDIGKIGVPFGSYQDRYHHQSSRVSPFMPLLREHHGGFLPSNDLGLKAYGRFPEFKNFNYSFGAFFGGRLKETDHPSNGHHGHGLSEIEYGESLRDDNRGKALSGRVGFGPFDWLDFGFSGYFDKLGRKDELDHQIWGTDVTLKFGSWKIIGEYAWGRQDFFKPAMNVGNHHGEEPESHHGEEPENHHDKGENHHEGENHNENGNHHNNDNGAAKHQSVESLRGRQTNRGHFLTAEYDFAVFARRNDLEWLEPLRWSFEYGSVEQASVSKDSYGSGLAYQLNESLTLKAGYRFIDSNNGKDDHQIMTGFVWRFGFGEKHRDHAH